MMTRATEGDAESQYELAWYYRVGMEVKQSDTTAVKLLRSAANQGHDDAAACLASYFDDENRTIKLTIDKMLHDIVLY
jgi:TPR repeat protein